MNLVDPEDVDLDDLEFDHEDIDGEPVYRHVDTGEKFIETSAGWRPA